MVFKNIRILLHENVKLEAYRYIVKCAIPVLDWYLCWHAFTDGIYIVVFITLQVQIPNAKFSKKLGNSYRDMGRPTEIVR